jgi:hypothetical protein
MFKLADSRGSGAGVYCGRHALYLGPSALIEYHETAAIGRGRGVARRRLRGGS